MRVLHISAGNMYGGVETLLVTLARYRELCPDMLPEFAVCFDGRLSTELAVIGAPLHELGETRIRQPLSLWRARRRLKDLLAREMFDAVLCHMAWPQAIFGPVVRVAGVPLVFWLHLATDGRHWLERWARHTLPDVAICPSQFTAATLPKIYPETPKEVVYYPVAPGVPRTEANRLAVRQEFNTPSDAIVIFQASRLQEWKGQKILLHALSRLREVDSWVCWLAGEPQRPAEFHYLRQLKEIATELGIGERVRFLGHRSDVPSLLTAADIYCQPNTGTEGLPIVFAEAMYAGLPIVSSAIGGFWELVDESCGILLKIGDHESLSDALQHLIDKRDLRERLGAAGANRIAHISGLENQLHKIHKVLLQTRTNRRIRSAN